MTGTEPVRLQLDVTGFDLARCQPYVDKCRTSGIRLTTLSELGDTPRNRRALYELNKECSADIPERGPLLRVRRVPPAPLRGARPRSARCRPGARRRPVDRHGGDLGPTAIRVRLQRDDGGAGPYRGRGISVAMKTFGIGFAGICGVSTVRTVHHPANARAIAMNRTLGYVDADR